ncbi:ATP-binding protein [Clostridium sp. 2218st1_F5_2218SCRN_220325]|uniref:ATP-binding protein n=1 Tax=Clostridium sp. 2218st1_F5_2218SCRN_220325 TaxID=3143056 RepID=UPI00319DEEE5
MNFLDTFRSIELILETGEVPLVVGESGIGKTALANKVAKDNGWKVVVIDGNLLKEGEIGGLPTVESYIVKSEEGCKIEKKTTIYAVHTKLREIDKEIENGNEVLLFIDELNRCEHAVQQELMNLILNREINGYKLDKNVKILAAMNPSNEYGAELDYQVVDMDPAQENRFVWLNMESDASEWINWAMNNNIEPKVVEFISTFPEYLHKVNEGDINATPRSFERISKTYSVYKQKKDSIPKEVFLNVIKGNVGRVIAQEFMSFINSDAKPIISYNDVFNGEELDERVVEQVKNENHTRLYISAMNILKSLESDIQNNKLNSGGFDYIQRLVEFSRLYPVDLMVGIMKDIKNNYGELYKIASENEEFIDLYFQSYSLIRG